jgi:copper chaperone
MSKFNVPDMSCGHCVAAIEKAVAAVDADAVLSFDLEARTVDVSSRLSEPELAALLDKEGYPNTLAG